MLRERVAEWLDSQDDVTDARPVVVGLRSSEWQGAVFTRGGEEAYYLIGNRPRHRNPTCYFITPFDNDRDYSNPFDWYIGGYIEKSPNKKTEEHPFGNHWVVVPWVIEGDSCSQIDDYADEEYKRANLTVREDR